MPSEASRPAEISARAVPGILPDLRAHVLKCASGAGVSPVQLDRIELAFEEALMNVCTHAYPDEPGMVSVSCFTESGRNHDPFFCIRITDNGVPFNPLEHAPGPTAANMKSRAPGGMGIVLLRRMVDRIDYARTDTANWTTLRFSLPAR